MLRIAGARTLLRRAAIGVSGSVAVGSAGLTAYSYTDHGRGFRREVQFWSRVFPVIFDYYWQVSSSSPYVRYKQWRQKPFLLMNDKEERSSMNNDDASKREQEEKKQVLQQLHERHAPDILQVMLDLKGLYIKLGQVLSVTTLPIPEPYRVLFRTLQSDVPGWEMFEEVVQPILEQELGPLEEIFEYIDPVPCGAASIGQAHKAILKNKSASDQQKGEQVIIKVQYPDAAWQVPADIQCVGDFLKICVLFGAVDETAANMSYNEFSRQFLQELDYSRERENLEHVYESSLDPSAPYIRRGVVVPKVHPELCSGKVITMSYLAGPKLEEEARQQLEALGIDTKRGLRNLVRDARKDDDAVVQNDNEQRTSGDSSSPITRTEEDIDSIVASRQSAATSNSTTNNKSSWRLTASKIVSNLVGLDTILWTVRMARRIVLWSTAAAVKSIQMASGASLVPISVLEWADAHSTAAQQAQRLALTQDWIDALFDVHGHQIFALGCFNADCHPGNILILDDNEETSQTDTTSQGKLGLIDFGQCKRLAPQEQVQIAQLVVRVANNESDERVAAAFRDLGIQTKNDSSKFLAEFARLMFGPLQSYHLDHAWHKDFHKLDAITYFPNQLSMAYRTSMLLRGLAVSLQVNVSVSDQWKDHAQAAIDRNTSLLALEDDNIVQTTTTTNDTAPASVLARRMTKQVVERLNEGTVNVS